MQAQNFTNIPSAERCSALAICGNCAGLGKLFGWLIEKRNMSGMREENSKQVVQHFHCTGHSTLEIGHCRINTRGPRMMSMICQPDATQTGVFPRPRRLCAVVSNKRQQGCPLHFNIHCCFLVLSYFLTSSLTVCFPVSFFGTLN